MPNAVSVRMVYYDAEFADALYSKTIRAFFGEKATRWTLTATQACNREVNAALRMKLDADTRYWESFRKRD